MSISEECFVILLLVMCGVRNWQTKCRGRLVVFVAAMAAATRGAELVVAPAGFERQQGNAQFAVGFQYSGEFQQLYSGQLFSQPVQITGFGFRPAYSITAPTYDMTIPNVAVRLTTYRGDASLFQPLYNLNAGKDDALVFEGSLHWTGRLDAPNTLNTFSMWIQLPRPFYFDPGNGRLLLEFNSSGPDGAYRMPSISTRDGGGLNSVWVNGLNAILPDTVITQFEYVIVPEPKTSALIALGASFLLLVSSSRGKSTPVTTSF